MGKPRRHATRIRQTGDPILSSFTTSVSEKLSGRFNHNTVLPGTAIVIAACLFMIGFNNANETSEYHGAEPQTIIASTDVYAADSKAHSEPSSASDSDRITQNLDIESALNRIIDGSQEQAELAQNYSKHRVTVKSGDTLSKIFDEAGLGAATLYRLTNSGPEGKALAKVFPGQELVFTLSDDSELVSLLHVLSPLEQIEFSANSEGFEATSVKRLPDVRTVQKSANVRSSLSEAAYDVDLSSGMTMNMANIFGGVMDFALDVRPNDSFMVIYEELYLDGEKIDDGNILAAQYVNNGKVFNAFRYVHENGEIGYYNEDGESMRKVFLRAPLDFTRVSSGFNLRRLHPISKKVKPHRGIDYAAPVGTPIFSVGDGRISASGYSKANGNFVFIRHGDTYQTKYLHLKKRHVSKGQRVKQGQIIGTVGCTGLCTGPHLHYEFLVNGVHRNPRTIVSKLPKAKRLAKTELNRFQSKTLASQNLLQHYGQQEMFALSE